MNLPLFLPGMLLIILPLLGVFIGMSIYLFKRKFKNAVLGKCLVIFSLSLTGLVLAYILSYTISSLLGRTQINTQLAEMRKQGIPICKSEIIPRMPKKASDNGIVYYKEAFALIDNEILKLDDLEDDYDLPAWSDENRKRAQQILDSQNSEKIFSLFRQGSEKPYAVCSRDYQNMKAQKYLVILPEMKRLRSLFRFISLKSSYDGLNGNSDIGYRLIGNGFKTIKQFESDPLIVSQLLGINCTAININAMNSLISRYGIGNRAAVELMEGLDKLNFNEAMAHAMDWELMMVRDFFENIISGKRTLYKFFMDGDLKSDNLIFYFVDIVQKYSPKQFIYQDYVCYLEQMAKVRALYFKPYWQEKEYIEELKNGLKEICPAYIISKCLIPALLVPRTQVARIESEIDAAKLTLALHIYKNNHGMFPDKLKQLIPEILLQIPVDPITGNPFEYCREANGSKFTLSWPWLKEKQEKYGRNQNKSK